MPVSWTTVGLIAVVIAFIDGFLITALQAAVGAIERSQQPFASWMRGSLIMLPMILVAILVALAISRRWVGQSRRKVAKYAATVLLIICATTAVSIAEVAASSAYDYHIQSRQIEQLHAAHVHAVGGNPVLVDATYKGTCAMVCTAKHLTVVAHLRAIKLASGLLLLVNFVLVLWALALRGGQIWLPRASAREQVSEPVTSVDFAGALA